MPPVHRLLRPGIPGSEDISDYARLYTVEVTSNAEEGSVAISTQVLDDPTASLDLSGRVQYQILESTATGSNQYIYVGTTKIRTFRRAAGHRTGVDREVETELEDLNTLLSNYILTESWANRPAETDVARVQAMVTNGGIINLNDQRFFSTGSPFQMPANDYRGQTNYAMLDDCAQESGKNWFIWWAGDIEDYSLWYDFSSSTSYSSPLRLSNVLSDIDSTWTFEISADTTLARDPSRVYSHIYLPWQNGAAFVGDFGTQQEFSIRHASMDGYNVKTQAQAEARALRYLAQASTEEDIVTTTVRLPAAKVNFLMQGMRVQFRATHLPGYEDEFTWFRVLRRTVVQEDELNYSVRLEMTAAPSVSGSCAVSVANVTSDVEGPLNGNPSAFGPYSLDGDLAVSFCSVGGNGYGLALGDELVPVGSSDWNGLGCKPGNIGGTHTMMNVAWRDLGSSQDISWEGPNGVYGGGIGVADGHVINFVIPGATFVQAATAVNGLGAPTWASPLTPGNMVVLCGTAEGPSSWTNEPPPVNEWTNIENFQGALEHTDSNMWVWCLCITEDNIDDIGTSNAGSSWWAHIFEVSF